MAKIGNLRKVATFVAFTVTLLALWGCNATPAMEPQAITATTQATPMNPIAATPAFQPTSSVAPAIPPTPTQPPLTTPVPTKRADVEAAYGAIMSKSGTYPVLVVGAALPGYSAKLSGDPIYAITYSNPDKRKAITLAMMLPGNSDLNVQQATPQFRGAKAFYQYNAAIGSQSLWWTEPVASAPGESAGLTYALSADGLSKDEFWQVADSLKAMPKGRILLSATGTAAAVPYGYVETIAYGTRWLPRGTSGSAQQPHDNPALAALNDTGMLWIALPKFGPGNGFADNLGPLGDYAIMFTPGTPGKDLAKSAKKLYTLPGTVTGSEAQPDVQYVASIETVANNTFLITTYTICCGAQNGAVSHYWLINPQSEAVKEIATSRDEGSGNKLTALHTQRWLFLNPGHVDVQSSEMVGDQAIVVDLSTGMSKAVRLGGANWAENVSWDTAEKLHFTLPNGNHKFLLDPQTGTVTVLR